MILFLGIPLQQMEAQKEICSKNRAIVFLLAKKKTLNYLYEIIFTLTNAQLDKSPPIKKMEYLAKNGIINIYNT